LRSDGCIEDALSPLLLLTLRHTRLHICQHAFVH